MEGVKYISETKFRIVLNLIEELYAVSDETDRLADIVYIDGGECTGTTTITKSVCERLNNRDKYIQTREPSLEVRKTIKDLINSGTLVNSTDENDNIIDIFMKDRYKNQISGFYKEDQIKISDRGIYSTFVYQSGLLNPIATEDDINRNCEIIYDSFFENWINLPKLAINLITIYEADALLSKDVNEFSRRLERRKKNNSLDAMDNIETLMTINKIYTRITKHMMSVSERVIGIDFKDSIESTSQFIVDIINTLE